MSSSLNPNAAEFIPFSLRASSSSSPDTCSSAKHLVHPSPDTKHLAHPSPDTKHLVSSPDTCSSAKHLVSPPDTKHLAHPSPDTKHLVPPSDEEVRQFWQHQLPDDITPDFKDHSQPLSLSSLSLHDTNSLFFNQTLTPSPSPSASPLSPFPHHPSSTTQSSNHNLKDDTFFDFTHPDPLHFLAFQFPGFAAESLAQLYYANSCDLNLTIEMLTQLELQVDGAFDQTINSKTLSAPNLTSMDFPALPVPDNKTNMPKFAGDELEQSVNPYRSSEKDNMFLFKTGSSLSSKGASDFASAVRKLASQGSGLWKYDRNGSADAIVGSSKSSHVLSASYDVGTGRSAYIDRMHSRSSSRAAPVWLETGDAVANLYSELREEARDHARIRNTYFEQARQAYLIGNKALAKELSVKGQVHNMQMKAAHNKAQESIYRQRNPISEEGQGVGRSHEKMIDLHGLHVSEAIHVLRHELGMLRNAARLSEQRLHVYICVGTGHHTRGSRTPARLPISVQRYLLQEEGLDFTEPQPGLLRVVLY